MLAWGKCKPCFALDFKDVGNKMAIDDGIFWEKYLISVKMLIFCKPGTSSSLKWRKFQVKVGSTRRLAAPPKSLIVIAELQCDFCQHQKWPVKQENLISTPG